MSAPHLDLPIDPTSRERLAAEGLRFGLVDPADAAVHAAWFRAETRGFLDAEPSDALIEQQRGLQSDSRMVGVWDDSIAEPAVPVATTICWPADLTVPGHRTLPAWAVSGVTVAPTHRRRGIARSLMEAELRTADALGLPVAMLTVSESTIYARYGYGIAALARDVTVQTARARWIGPDVTGRVHFVSAAQLLDDGHSIVERVRPLTPGQISYPQEGKLWRRQLGLTVEDTDAKKLRFIRYDDADGTAQGFAIYQLKEDPSDFTQHELAVNTLVAATPGAYAGLWRFLLEHDLVAKVTAHLRPIDEPLRWMISDFRAATVSEFDHLWVRVLDVVKALTARTYASPGRLVIQVDDDHGYADGTWVLDVDADGAATVTRGDETPDVRLGVAALGSLLLGGIRATALAAAGSVHGDAGRLDEMFGSPVEPYLSIWF